MSVNIIDPDEPIRLLAKVLGEVEEYYDKHGYVALYLGDAQRGKILVKGAHWYSARPLMTYAHLKVDKWFQKENAHVKARREDVKLRFTPKTTSQELAAIAFAKGITETLGIDCEIVKV
jgi:hypothetical protein